MKLHDHRRSPQPTVWTITTTTILRTAHHLEVRWRIINRRWMRCHHMQSLELEQPWPSTKTKHQNKQSWAQHVKTNKTQTGKNGRRTKQKTQIQLCTSSQPPLSSVPKVVPDPQQSAATTRTDPTKLETELAAMKSKVDDGRYEQKAVNPTTNHKPETRCWCRREGRTYHLLR